jgi:hypothetical protein
MYLIFEIENSAIFYWLSLQREAFLLYDAPAKPKFALVKPLKIPDSTLELSLIKKRIIIRKKYLLLLRIYGLKMVT